MVDKLRISAVSYLNTLPFVYGIKNSGLLPGCDLQLDIPSECARKFINREADIALVPAAALFDISGYKLLDKYCIGSSGEVKTVMLLSKVPLDEIKEIHLDYHSLTSVTLVKILAKHFWEIYPEWKKLDINSESNMNTFESIVAIGDKTFTLASEFEYFYDLAYEWRLFCGLPFVFACWIAGENISQEVINDFSKAIEWGVNNKKKAIENLFDRDKFPLIDIDDYLERNIDFIFDKPKHKALALFFDYIKDLRTET